MDQIWLYYLLEKSNHTVALDHSDMQHQYARLWRGHKERIPHQRKKKFRIQVVQTHLKFVRDESSSNIIV
jgi:hypothetical protein